MDGKPFQNRIIGMGMQAASRFQFNPSNWRLHPDSQRAALNKVLSSIGWVTGVIVNSTTGNLIDGHARIEEALKQGKDTQVPFTEVKLTEEEEAKILLLFDPISGMAETDEHAIALLKEIAGIDDVDLLAALAPCSEELPSFETLEDSFGLPEGDKEPFQTMTFTLSNDQAEIVKAALQKAKDAGPFVNTGNENSNGNALARIAEDYA